MSSKLIVGAILIGVAILGIGIFLGQRYATPTAAEPPPTTAVKEIPVPAGETTEQEQEETTASPPVVSATSEEAPNFFYGDDCPPEENPGGCSFDVGVNPNQIGLAFGWHIKWPQASLDAGGNGCDLVLLNPGWYENLWLLDARIEVYDVPERDRQGWIEVLAIQRAEEQMFNYDCIGKDLSDIPVWDSSRPSPPISAATSAETAEQAAPAPTFERRTTGQNLSLRFSKGEAVYGWRIELDSGQDCNGGECYLPSAPGPGTVTSGVVNPWASEVQGVTPWDPS